MADCRLRTEGGDQRPLVALQIAQSLDDVETAGRRDGRADGVALPEAKLQLQPAAGREARGRLCDEGADLVQAVVAAAVERGIRLVIADVGAEFPTWRLAGTDGELSEADAEQLAACHLGLPAIADATIIPVERSGYTLVPLDMHYVKGRIKLEVGLAKGKKQHDKRESERERDWQRQRQRLSRTP